MPDSGPVLKTSDDIEALPSFDTDERPVALPAPAVDRACCRWMRPAHVDLS